MPRGISVETRGIAIEQRADIGRLFQIVAVDRLARMEQVEHIVGLRPIGAIERTEPPARHGDYLLQGREIVLGMSISDAVGDVGIGRAEDVWDAEFIPRDHRVVMMLGRRLGAECSQRLPGREPNRGEHQQHGQTQADPFQNPQIPALPTVCRRGGVREAARFVTE